MIRLYFTLLLACAFNAIAQDQNRYFLDSAYVKTDEGKHAYYRIVSQDPESEWFSSCTYYKSGKLFEKVRCSTKEGGFYDGPFRQYWENGNRKKESNFENGREIGGVQTWYEDGKPHCLGYWQDSSGKGSKHDFMISQFWNPQGLQTVTDGKGHYSERDGNLWEEGEIDNEVRVGKWTGKNFRYGLSFEEMYDAKGIFVSGHSSDTSGNRYEYDEIDERTSYGASMQDFYRYIQKNFRTPSDQSQTGRLIVTFTVDPDGEVKDIKIVRSMGRKADAEAERILSRMGRWNPARHRGIAIKTTFSLPIQITATH